MNAEQEWHNLTLAQFVERCYPKPLSVGLRAVVNDERRSDPPYKTMREFRTEADIYRIRRVGRQTGAAIVAAMKSLGWVPQPDPKEINDLCHSAVLQLDCVATRLRRFTKGNPILAKRIENLGRRVSRVSVELRALRNEWCGSPGEPDR